MRPLTLLLLCVLGSAAFAQEEKTRYLRPAGDKFELECEFMLNEVNGGLRIESVTHRGKTKMTVKSQFDRDDRLLSANVVLETGDKVSSATVTVEAGKAKVQRKGQAEQELDAPPAVLVTSAPDWSDAFRLCRHYDRSGSGKQNFPCLWIHPDQPSQRFSIFIARIEKVKVDHAGKKVELERCTIWLRGKSEYAVWADDRGRMIKLVPLPYKEGATNWLVLEGYEKSTAMLRPQ